MVDIYPYDAIADFDRVLPDAGQVGVRANAAIQIELPMMPLPLDDVARHSLSGQVSARVRAAIVDHDDALRVGQPKNRKLAIAHGHKRPTVGTASR